MNNQNEKEELLIQALKTQQSILTLLDHTLLDIYKAETNLPQEQQNQEVINLSYQIRNIVGKKPKLKELYKRLEEEHGVDFSRE
ncbi:hypothetical protein NC661_11675 [Aquibacillus koreensis]|uniref:Uncharacterized protein n=1 Tax=Aquibacillus koreensis TaxID=279446 RepID=A0A9X4AK30_9BACI|nr:hypothetical protein [Aquibacillus koreensis]MCT2535171.1 hypothetical protein [Aquibacillus koreensis]MDC3421030.1 hypothetical protein [Aquibacillus koreensis]